MMFAKTPTAIDYWMLAAIGFILVALIFLSLAEMSLSQMTKPRAAALAEKGAKSGKAIIRNVLVSLLTMGITYGIGQLVGTSLEH